MRPHSIESRKPIARYMIGSIMKRYSKEKMCRSPCHGARAKHQPVAGLT
jgi:hypothetical protein